MASASARHRTTVYGAPEVGDQLPEPAEHSLLSVASINLPPTPADPFTDWVTAPARALIAHLRDRDTDPDADVKSRPLAILLICPAPAGDVESAALTAAIEAVRGITQSVVREKTTDWAPVNAIAVDRLAVTRDALPVVEFLASAGGAFTSGATFDLISPDRSTR